MPPSSPPWSYAMSPCCSEHHYSKGTRTLISLFHTEDGTAGSGCGALRKEGQSLEAPLAARAPAPTCMPTCVPTSVCPHLHALLRACLCAHIGVPSPACPSACPPACPPALHRGSRDSGHQPAQLTPLERSGGEVEHSLPCSPVATQFVVNPHPRIFSH